MVLKGYSRESLTLQTRQRVFSEVSLLQRAQCPFILKCFDSFEDQVRAAMTHCYPAFPLCYPACGRACAPLPLCHLVGCTPALRCVPNPGLDTSQHHRSAVPGIPVPTLPPCVRLASLPSPRAGGGWCWRTVRRGTCTASCSRRGPFGRRAGWCRRWVWVKGHETGSWLVSQVGVGCRLRG